MDIEDDPEEWRHFNNKTREYVVFLLLFLMLYFSSYGLIVAYKKKRNGIFYSTYEDAVVYRISLWICTFSLGVSIGAALLLPMSIISIEVLTSYPNSYYVQWLNSSVIQGMWNLVFLFSNLALFILLPFSHILIESEGLPGSQKGVISRAYEAGVILILLGVMLMGITYIISALFDDGHYSIASVFNLSSYYLPFLYSCVSFLGVLMLLICTPMGFARIFTGMGKFLMKLKTYDCNGLDGVNEGSEHDLDESSNFQSALHKPPNGASLHRRKIYGNIPFIIHREKPPEIPNIVEIYEAKEKQRKKYSYLARNGIYPVMMLLLLTLTALSVLLVSHNSIELCMGFKALPLSSKTEDRVIELNPKPLSIVYGSVLEIILILYLWCVSILGLYSLPLFSNLKPKLHCTSMSQIIGNCAILLVLSSALPVFARSLGLTNFDLLGDFGRINWLGNFNIVLFHNIVFTVTTVVCVGTKITSAVRNELYRRLCRIIHPVSKES